MSRAPIEPAISNAYSTPPPVAAFTWATMSGSRALKVSVAPSSRAKSSFCSDRAIATIRRAPDGDRAEQRGQADAAEPDHGDRGAGGHLGRVEDGTDAGQHGAAEQGGLLQGQVLVDLDQRMA